MEAVDAEVAKWHELIHLGEEAASVSLTELQKNHLTSVFVKTHISDTFLRKLHSVRVMHMQKEAEEAPGPQRIEALVDVGDACLFKAGFPKLISRHVRKFNRNPCMLVIRVGRQCYENLAENTFSAKKRGSGWDELAYGFDEMVEVLWACQANGYPDLNELLEMCRVAQFRCAQRTMKRIYNSIPVD